ncbi:MAG: HEPN domain-containing protein [Actinobacteria bacterium]|nr:HEPN domain-containing protein [Actinomycetota bacterium]
MRKEAQLWLDGAAYDLDSARDLFKSARYNYSVWLSRQAVEKALKAAHLIVIRKPIPRSHNLIELARELSWDIPRAVKEHLQFLNPHYTVTRYVDSAVGKPSDIYDAEIADQAIVKSKEVLDWVVGNLKIS